MCRNHLKIHLLSRQLWSARVLRITPVDGLEHVAKLRRRDRDNPVDRRWPDETATLQTLGIKLRIPLKWAGYSGLKWATAPT